MAKTLAQMLNLARRRRMHGMDGIHKRKIPRQEEVSKLPFRKLKRQEEEMVRSFLDFYYQYDLPKSLAALLQGNSTQTSYGIFISRFQSACRQAKFTFTLEEGELIWEHIVNMAADQALTLICKEGWILRIYDRKTDEVLAAREWLLANRVVKAKSDEVELAQLKSHETTTKRKFLDDGVTEQFASMALEDSGEEADVDECEDWAGDGLQGSSASGRVVVSQNHLFVRKIAPMRRNRMTGRSGIELDG